MGTDYIKYAVDLQQELDDAKLTLVSLNDNIRRIIGRRNEKPKMPIESKRNDDLKHKRRSYESKSVFNRLSGPPPRSPVEEEVRPRLYSRVIRELPTREDIVTAQGTDLESRARNRRMFGCLLGTLQKFCQEESRLKQKEEKKLLIEKKLEKQELQERETLKKERELLFMDRKKKQMEIKMLELKMSRVKDFENWESSVKNLKPFLRTNTKPHIYYKPRNLCKKTEKLLLDNQKNIEEMIEKKREALNKELSEFERDYKGMDIDPEDQFDISESGDRIDDEKSKNNEFKSQIQRRNSRDNSINLEIDIKKGELDSKENNSRSSNERSLSSSIVVVKKSPSDKK